MGAVVIICLQKKISFYKPQSEIGNLAAFHLQLEFISDQRNKLRIRGFALCVCVGNVSTNKTNPATARFNK